MSFQAKEEADIGTNLNNHSQCPKCGSPNYYEIIYGDPTHEAFLKKSVVKQYYSVVALMKKTLPVNCVKSVIIDIIKYYILYKFNFFIISIYLYSINFDNLMLFIFLLLLVNYICQIWVIYINILY